MAKIDTSKVVVQDTRIQKLRTYLFGIISQLLTDTNYQINANMLSSDVNNYSLDKIPVENSIEQWIIGDIIHRDVYSFRSRNSYNQEALNNLLNIGFFEIFENKIKAKNEANDLPDIEGIESIKCLNCGTMVSASTNTAEFDIQIQIVYRDNGEENLPSI